GIPLRCARICAMVIFWAFGICGKNLSSVSVSSNFPSSTSCKIIAAVNIFLWAGADVEVYGDGMSDVSEQRRKEDHDYRRPRDVDRQVIRLPAFEIRERPAPSQEAEVEHGGPRQIDQENHVLAQG